MQLYCKPVGGASLVIAVHPDGDQTPTSAYGTGVTILPYAGTTPVAALVGKPAPGVDLLAYAAARRWQTETGGVVATLASGQIAVATDDRSKTLVLGARAAAQADPTFTTQWQALDGGEHTLGAADVITLSNIVAKHVADTFAAYALVKAGRAAVPATINTTADVDAAYASLQLPPAAPAD